MERGPRGSRRKGRAARSLTLECLEDRRLLASGDWGPVSYHRTDLELAGDEHQFQLQSTRQGWLTVLAEYSPGSSLSLHLVDEGGREVGRSSPVPGGQRLDAHVDSHRPFQLNVRGSHPSVTLTAANLVQTRGRELSVNGTEGSDDVVVQVPADERAHWRVEVKQLGYSFKADQFDTVNVSPGAGGDSVRVEFPGGVTEAVVGSTWSNVTGSSRLVATRDVEGLDLVAASHPDQNSVAFYDSPGADRWTSHQDSAVFSGAGFQHSVFGFARQQAFSTAGGKDRAVLYGTSREDVFHATPDRAWFETGDQTRQANGFREVDAFATLHQADRAYLYDSPENDRFFSKGRTAWASGPQSMNRVHDFQRVDSFFRAGGADRVYMYDTPSNDVFYAKGSRAWSETVHGVHYFKGFPRTDVYSIYGGDDVAHLYDTIRDDAFYAKGSRAWVETSAEVHHTQGVGRVHAYSVYGGTDRAYLYDSAGDDTFYGKGHRAWIEGDGFRHHAKGFGRVDAYSVYGGVDQAYLYDTAFHDVFYSKGSRAWIESWGSRHLAQGFAQLDAYSVYGGIDHAYLYDSPGDDSVVVKADRAWIENQDYRHRVQGFGELRTIAAYGGEDTLWMFGTSAGEEFVSRGSDVGMSGPEMFTEGKNFEVVHAFGGGGRDRAEFYDMRHEDRLDAERIEASARRGGRRISAWHFDDVLAVARDGERPSALVLDMDFVLTLVGDWRLL